MDSVPTNIDTHFKPMSYTEMQTELEFQFSRISHLAFNYDCKGENSDILYMGEPAMPPAPPPSCNRVTKKEKNILNVCPSFFCK
jgi:hypothetical protein